MPPSRLHPLPTTAAGTATDAIPASHLASDQRPVSRLNLDKVRRFASPQLSHSRLEPLERLGLSLRVTSMALLTGVASIHLHLWQVGYRHIPTIGPLFLVAAMSCFALAVGLLVWPSRLLGVLALGADLSILASLVASINIGLFGFHETLSAPFVVESIAVESIAAAALIAWVAIDYAAEIGRPAAFKRSAGDPDVGDEESWTRWAREAEADAAELARALEFHTVNECDCHGASDLATLRRHEARVVSHPDGPTSIRARRSVNEHPFLRSHDRRAPRSQGVDRATG